MEELVVFLKNELWKFKSLRSISEKFNISELEILGIIYKLKEEGINIDYFEKDGESFLVRNEHPDLSKENTMSFNCDINAETRVAFIADIRAGSRMEQFQILRDMYKKFKEQGITKVFILGNLIEGKYEGKMLREFGKSLITNDAYAQADHFIELFPYEEGITTYFITGKKDHSFYRELNVGEYIASKRKDMVYLGPKSCNVYFNNVLFHLEQLKNGDAYTIAYPEHKYSRSMTSTEIYDAIFLSGGLNFQFFPQVRDTMIFSIPSVVGRTPKMISDNRSNTLGTFIFSIEFTKSGKLKRLLPLVSPYEASKESQIISGRDKRSPKEIIRTGDISAIESIYDLMNKEEVFEELRDRLEITDNELYGIINVLRQIGKEIEVISRDGELIVRKKVVKRSRSEIKPRMEELHKKTFGVVSDTHYGSIFSQPSMVNTFVYECFNRGITDILHVGDITDGDYSRVRPIHNSEVFLYGATGQLDYVIKTLPRYHGIHWYGITGNHDQTHFFNYGMHIGEELAKKREDFTYLGQDRAFFKFDNCTIELFHPGVGTSRILSTKPQNLQDQLSVSEHVDLSLWGHFHKNYYMFYNNTHIFLLPSNVAQSSFMMKNGLPNLMGDYILTIYYDDSGRIHYIIPEVMIFDERDVREHDYENPRIIRNKVLTKRIR